MAILLWARVVLLTGLAAVIAGCVWTGLGKRDE